MVRASSSMLSLRLIVELRYRISFAICSWRKFRFVVGLGVCGTYYGKGWACVGYVIILFIAIVGFGLISSLKNQKKDSQERGKQTDADD